MGSNTEFLKLANTIWKSNFERISLSSSFKPVFCRVIGFDDEREYNSILKFLYNKAESCNGCVFFANEIPVSSDFDMISSISAELSHMDLNDLSHADIIMFDNTVLNDTFLNNLSIVVKAYESFKGFRNQSIKIDFITKMILWIYEYIRPIQEEFEKSSCPECIYFGDISDHEQSFLYLLHLMNLDVIYINPLKDCMSGFSEHVCEMELINYPRISQIGNIMDRINSASDVSVNQSTTLQFMNEIQESLFTGTGVYRPWQLKEYNLQPLNQQMTIYDLKSNINEYARVRAGFSVDGNTVTTPNIFMQIDGVPDEADMEEYLNLFEDCMKGEHKMLLTDKGAKLIRHTLTDDEKLQLVFCKPTGDRYDAEELKKLSSYTWNMYNKTVEKRLVDALNQVMQESVLSKTLSQDKEFTLVDHILSIHSDIIKMVDNYDYPEEVPRIVIFLENEDFIQQEAIQVLVFLYELGFDIVIFNPSGLMSISSEINLNVFNSHRYDRMVYDLTLEKLKVKKKFKGFFGFLFQ